MSSKGTTGGLLGHNFKLRIDILELMRKSKNKVFGVICGSFLEETIAFLILLKKVIWKKKKVYEWGVAKKITLLFYVLHQFNILKSIKIVT